MHHYCAATTAMTTRATTTARATRTTVSRRVRSCLQAAWNLRRRRYSWLVGEFILLINYAEVFRQSFARRGAVPDLRCARVRRIKEKRCRPTVSVVQQILQARESRRQTCRNLHLRHNPSQENELGMVLWSVDHELPLPSHPLTLSSLRRDKSLFSK